MSARIMMMLFGMVELAAGIGIGWLLLRSEQPHRTHAAQLAVTALERATAVLGDLALQALELKKSLARIETSVPESDSARRDHERLSDRAYHQSDRLHCGLQSLAASLEEFMLGQSPPPKICSIEQGDCRQVGPAEEVHLADAVGQEISDLVEEAIVQSSESPSNSFAEDERRQVPRYEVTMSLTVIPLDERLKPVGARFGATSKDLSKRGISFVHHAPLDGRLCLIEIPALTGPPTRVLVERVRSRETGEAHTTGGRFIAQVPAALAAAMLSAQGLGSSLLRI